MGDFEKAYRFTRKEEGGFSDDKDDKGHQTKYGITTKTFVAAQGAGLIDRSLRSVRDITPDDAKRVYREWYWKQIKGDELPQELATVLFDTAVNSGPPAATKKLQEVLKIAPDGRMGPKTLDAIKNYQGNLARDLVDARLRKYEGIVENDSTQKKFIKGWRNRINDLHELLDHTTGPTTNSAPGRKVSPPPPGSSSPPPHLSPELHSFLSSLLRRNPLAEPLSQPVSGYGTAPLPSSLSAAMSGNLPTEPFPQPGTYVAGPFVPYPRSWRRNLLEAPFSGFDDGT